MVKEKSKTNASEFAEKWASRMSSAGTYIEAGVRRVTVAPSQKAIAKQDKMLANFIESVNNGTWAANLGKVSLADWQDSMINKGLARIATGATKAKAKVQAKAHALLDHINAGLSRIAAMPNNTIEDAIARQAEWTR